MTVRGGMNTAVSFGVHACRLDDEEDEVVKRLTSIFSAETKRRDDEERM